MARAQNDGKSDCILMYFDVCDVQYVFSIVSFNCMAFDLYAALHMYTPPFLYAAHLNATVFSGCAFFTCMLLSYLDVVSSSV